MLSTIPSSCLETMQRMKFRWISLHCSVVLDYATTCSLNRWQTKCKLFFSATEIKLWFHLSAKVNHLRLTHQYRAIFHSFSESFSLKAGCIKSQSLLQVVHCLECWWYIQIVKTKTSRVRFNFCARNLPWFHNSAQEVVMIVSITTCVLGREQILCSQCDFDHNPPRG